MNLDNQNPISYIDHLRNILRLDGNHKNVKFHNFIVQEVYCLKTKIDHIKIEVTFTFGLEFKVDMKILFPKIVDNHIDSISKLIIWVQDAEIRNEIRSYTNYLQRQKNLNLALSILKKFAVAIGERKLILDLLLLHSEGFFKIKVQEDGGFLIVCNCERANYFKSEWMIQFDCNTHNIFDHIDFTLRRSTGFYLDVKIIMDKLVAPNLPYNLKVEYWLCIIEALKANTELPTYEIIESDSWNDKDFILVRSVPALHDRIAEQYAIIESEEEDCFIVKP